MALSAVVLLAIAIRLVLAATVPVFLEGDSQSYLVPGLELANGEGFSPELRRAPAYPLFIAVAFGLVDGSLPALALAQHVVGVATVCVAFLLGRRLFGSGAGLVASLHVTLSGPQLIYERYVMTEALFGLVLAAVAAAIFEAIDRPTPVRLIVAGCCIGVAALTRPVAQALLPLLLVTLLALLPRWRPALKAATLVFAGYALIAAPWITRNLLAHESASAAGGLGRSLIARTVKYDGLFDWKWLSETYGDRDDLAARERMLLYRKRANIHEGRSVRSYQDALMKELGLSQAQADRAMQDVALEAIARRPLDYLAGSLRFTGEVLVGREETIQSHWKQRANKDWVEQWDDRLDFLVGPVGPWQPYALEPGDGVRQQLAFWLTDLYQPSRHAWILLPLVLFGLLGPLGADRRLASWLLLGIAVSVIVLSAFLDGPVLRYRYPVDPLLAVLAAGGLMSLLYVVRVRTGFVPAIPQAVRNFRAWSRAEY